MRVLSRKFAFTRHTMLKPIIGPAPLDTGPTNQETRGLSRVQPKLLSRLGSHRTLRLLVLILVLYMVSAGSLIPPTEAASPILEPGFETVNNWTFTRTITTHEGSQTTAWKTEGNYSYQLKYQAALDLRDGHGEVYQDNINLTGVDRIRFDAELNAWGITVGHLNASVRVDSVVLWSRHLSLETIEYLNQTIDVSSYPGEHTLAFRLTNLDIASVLSGGTFRIDNLNEETTVTITSSPTTGSGFVKVDDVAYSTPHDFIWTIGAEHKLEALSPVSGGTGIQYVWTSWSDGGTQTHTYTTPSSSATVTANYKTQYRLTVASDHDSPVPGVGSDHWYDTGTSIDASVTSPADESAGTRYRCTGWGGTGSVPSSGTEASVTFSITAPSSITWNWATQYQVSFAINPPGPPTPGSTSPSETAYYDAGLLPVSATANPGYAFASWSSSTESITFASSSQPSTTATINGPGTITANFQAAVVDHIVVSPKSASITAGESQAYTATAYDASGNSWNITSSASWGIDAGAGGSWSSVNPNVYTSEKASGVSPWTVTATYSSKSDTASLTVNHASAASVVVSPDSQSVTAGLTATFTATASDAYGNTWDVSTDPGTTWSIDAGAGGSWSANVYTSAKAGTWTVTGTYEGNFDSASLTVNVGVLDHFVFAPVTSPQTAGSPFSITITALDAHGNVVVAYAGSNSLGDSTGTIAPTMTGAFTGGSWTGSVTINKPQAGVTISTIGNSVTGTSNSFDMNSAGGNKLVITVSPSSVTAGSWTTVYSVQRQDQHGNPVTSGSTTVDLASTCTGSARKFAETPGGPTVTSIIIPDGNSAADFYYYDEKAGSWMISVSATDFTGDSEPLTVNAAALDHFVFDSISSPQTDRSAFSITITAKDQYGNTVTTYTGTNTLSDSTGTITPTSTGPFTSGVWTGSVTITQAQAGVIITTTGSGRTGASNSFDVDDPKPVGGELLPVSKQRLLAPYLILAVLIASVSASLITKRRAQNSQAVSLGMNRRTARCLILSATEFGRFMLPP